MAECPSCADLQNYLTDSLPPEQDDLVLSHLEDCNACQQLLDSLTSGALVRRAVASESAAVHSTAHPRVEPAHRLSRQIGQYTLIHELGEGGMGVVYLAEQANLKRRVAVKIIRHGVNATAEEVARFCAEAEAVARLQHPNIVQIHEVGTQEGVYYLVLEYIGGGSLDHYLASTPQEPRVAARVTETLARAVYHAHQRGILHRDLKPANVLLQVSEQQPLNSTDKFLPFDLGSAIPKVTDFGLAKRLDTGDGRTQTGLLLGTPSYMAPEQFSGRPGSQTPTVDVYGLGAILYQMLTGRPPFKGATPLSTLEQVTSQEPLAPRQFQRHIPTDLESICLKCLEKDPRRRYASAERLADDLGRFLAGRPTLARPVRSWGRAWKWAKRRPLDAALTVAVVLVAVRGLEGILWQWRDTRWQLYRADIAAATSALQLHNSPTARRTLEQAPSEFRNWEWRYLQSQVESVSMVLTGHTAPVIGVAFSPDGKRVVSYSRDHTLRLWETKSGKTIAVCKGHDKEVESLAYSPMGNRFASGSNDHTVRLWDGESGAAIAVCSGHTHAVMGLAFSPDGAQLASAALDDDVCRIWDAATGEAVAELPRTAAKGLTLARNGQSLTFTPDGTRILVCGHDAVHVLDTKMKEERILRDSQAPLSTIAVSPDGRFVVAGADYPDDGIRLWELDTGELLGLMSGHQNHVMSVQFSPDGAHILSASMDRTLRVWDVPRRTQVAVLAGHSGTVMHAIFKPDGTCVVSASIDGTLRLWDPADGELLSVLRGHSEPIWGCAFSPDGNLLASASLDGNVRLWDTARIESNGALRGHQATVYDVAFAPDGRHVASVAWDNSTRLWDATSGQQIALFKGPGNLDPTQPDVNNEKVASGWGDYILSVAFSPDGSRLATGSRDGKVQFWDVKAGRLEQTVQLPGHGIDSLAFSPDGTLLAAALGHAYSSPDPKGDYGACLLDARSGNTLRIVRGHDDGVLAVRFAPDGRRLVTAGFDKTIRVWQTDTGDMLAELPGHTDRVNAVAFNRRGTLFATASHDRTVRLWDAHQLREIGVLPHASTVYAATFSPDGTRLVSGCEDNTIRFWDPTRREEVAELHGHASLVHAIAFSPDGSCLVTGSGDTTVRIWNTRPIERRASE